MKAAFALALLCVPWVSSCQSYARAADQGPDHCGLLIQVAGQCEAIQAQRDAADNAQCLSYGAMPGTDVYVQCRLELARERTLRPPSVVTAPAQPENGAYAQPTSGLDSRTGQACIGYQVPNPYGPPKFYCQ